MRPSPFCYWLIFLLMPIYGALAQENGIGGNLVSGKALYAVCAGCHDLQAQGNQDVSAPKLAGQEPWYLTRQLAYYQAGVRGGDPADSHGARMAVMSLALPTERAVEDVVAYIQTLPDTVPQPTITGDVANGRDLFAICSACHGSQGEGNVALSAPRLIRMDDWYLLTQLEAYLDGTRGTHRDDIYGQQMVPTMGALTNEQAVRDVVAYITSLN